MKMVYNVKDKPPFGKMLVYALQQMLAILAATIAVPAAINSNPDILDHFAGQSVNMSQAAALFGAGVGTLVYQLFTKFKSPVFLGSSFAFLGSMAAAFCGATTMALGFTGLIIGAVMAGLVYVIIAILVKFCGVGWLNKLMPPVVIGPTVAIIGLSLAGNAVGDLQNGGVSTANTYLCIVCGLVTLFATIGASVYGGKSIKLIPFIIGIAAGYIFASIFTVIGTVANVDALKVVDFSKFTHMQWLPDFTFIEAFKGVKEVNGAYIGTIAVAYVPVAFVVFAEHIADHKNLSSIIESDLLKEGNPGLDRTLLGDGVGSMAGALFGGCPNTTYGESVGCVAITGNASVATITTTAFVCIAAAFVAPFVTLLATIPGCVMGGVCVALYGFIAVSGLKMVQKVDLEDNGNLFTVSAILIAGIGGLNLTFGKVTITEIACALILGILVNVFCRAFKKKEVKAETVTATEEDKATEEENK